MRRPSFEPRRARPGMTSVRAVQERREAGGAHTVCSPQPRGQETHMKVQVPKKAMADALQHVERIVPTRSSNPGLNLVRVDLLGDALRFSGTNLDLDIEATVSADVRGEGTVALPAQVFGQVVRALPGDVVDIEVEDTEISLSSDGFATRLQLVDPTS